MRIVRKIVINHEKDNSIFKLAFRRISINFDGKIGIFQCVFLIFQNEERLRFKREKSVYGVSRYQNENNHNFGLLLARIKARGGGWGGGGGINIKVEVYTVITGKL